MPKNRPLPGRCVHCLKFHKLLTWDHILPDSWYPDEEKESEKWKVPSCEPCNKELGKIEEDLLLRLGLCLDPNDLASLGIPDKVLRSINPAYGKNSRDKEFRKFIREKIIKEVRYLNKPPKTGVFPNFGPISGLIYQNYAVVELPEGQNY